jgi:hypothetical protein
LFLSGDYSTKKKWSSDSGDYAVLSIDYLFYAYFVVYPVSGLKNHMQGLPAILENSSVVSAADLDSLDEEDMASSMKSLFETLIGYQKDEDHIYAVVVSGFPYPDSYNLEILDEDRLSPEDVPAEAYKTMPNILYYFIDSENRLFEMAGAYDLIDAAGNAVEYNVTLYTPPETGSIGGYVHNVPSDIDKTLLRFGNEGWTAENKGTMNALEIITAYPEKGYLALGQSVHLGGRAINARKYEYSELDPSEEVDKDFLFIERTSLYTYPDWGL